MDEQLHIFTVGHSTRSIEDFIELLKHYNITQLVDVRTIPKSFHNPQFNGPVLAHTLRNHHIGYRHQKNLGGYRHPHTNSVNMAWENASFRGFADYMQTEEFNKGILKLIESARKKRVVIMCSEAVPWRCHRSLIGDALVVRGVQVDDIYSMTASKPHKLTSWAVVKGNRITYPAQDISESDI